MVDIIIKIISLATLFSHIFLLFLFVLLFFKLSENRHFKNFFDLLNKYALLSAFVVALSAALGSLFFSEIANFEPCKLCWWQRVFLYPQVIIFGIALWQKDYRVRIYAVFLSAIGATIAGYQNFVALLTPISPLGSCSVDGPSCATNYFTEFGYITTPIMSFTAFTLIVLLMYISNHNNNLKTYGTS